MVTDRRTRPRKSERKKEGRRTRHTGKGGGEWKERRGSNEVEMGGVGLRLSSTERETREVARVRDRATGK